MRKRKRKTEKKICRKKDGKERQIKPKKHQNTEKCKIKIEK